LNESSAGSNLYAETISKLDPTRPVHVYSNFEEIKKSNQAAIPKIYERIKKLKEKDIQFSTPLYFFREHRIAAFSIDFASSHLFLESYSLLKEDSKFLNLYRSVQPKRNIMLNIGEKPVLLFSVGLNLSNCYKIFPYKPENLILTREFLKENFEITSPVDIDLKKDIIDNITGNISLGIYDESSISISRLNLLLSLEIKDKKTSKKTITNLVEMILSGKKEPVKNGEIKVIKKFVGPFQLHAAIMGNHLIITSDKYMFEKAIKGASTKEFVKKLNDPDLAKELTGKANFIKYLDVSEATDIFLRFVRFFRASEIKNNETFGKKGEILKRIKAVLYSNENKKTEIYNRWIVKTNFSKPFFIGLLNMIKDLQQTEGF